MELVLQGMEQSAEGVGKKRDNGLEVGRDGEQAGVYFKR